jgi:hypothetical protein
VSARAARASGCSTCSGSPAAAFDEEEDEDEDDEEEDEEEEEAAAAGADVRAFFASEAMLAAVETTGAADLVV